MEQDEHLEDGEVRRLTSTCVRISNVICLLQIEDDDVINAYIPLKRPETYALDIPQKRFPEVQAHYSDSEQELQSSDTDSDSDEGPRKKKKSKKLLPKPLKQKSDKLKKYDVWSARAQEDVLGT